LTFILCLHRIFWYSKQFEGKTSEKEPWYGTDYIIERIDKKLLEVQIFFLHLLCICTVVKGCLLHAVAINKGFTMLVLLQYWNLGWLKEFLYLMSCVQCRNGVSKRSLEIVELES
jgi:hypothetical protein